MKRWTKTDASAYLDDLILEIDTLKRGKRHSSEHIRWLTNTLVFLDEVFGADSYYHVNIKNLTWSFSGRRIISGWNPNEEIDHLHQQAYIKQLGTAKGFLLSAKDYLNSNDIDTAHIASVEKQASNELMKVLSLSENKLRKTIRTKPEKEREIQDSFENLLIGAEIDYRREAPHIEYSSKCYIPDFSFNTIGLAVEIKLCKADEKILIQQINDDILAYKTQFDNILFIIYDLGTIRDSDKFKQSFENTENVIVHITKH